MKASYEKRVDELRSDLKPGEVVEAVARFNPWPGMALFFFVAIVSFVAGRIFVNQMMVLLLTNVLSMWMMVYAARTLVSAQNSCVLVTDRRTFGTADSKTFNLPHRKITGMHLRHGLFLDGGNAHASVVLKNLANTKDVHAAIAKHL